MKSLQQYTLLKALRPFSLVVALISCALGILIAWNDGFQNIELAILIISGGILAQAGINLINDIEDLPLISNRHASYTLVKNRIDRNTRAGILCFVLASIIGLYLISKQGWLLFFLIFISGLASLSYNIGPINFKHRGLAMFQVFLLMGVFMVQGAYLAMSGQLSMPAFLHSIPVSLLVSLLLLSNELRDWETDRNSEIQTLTVRIGYQNAVKLYWLLIALSYLLALIFFFAGKLHTPLWLLAPLPLLIPIRNYLKASKRTQLTPMTGRFFFLFGLTYILALGIN
ncbi:MAG: prenyltransferase [Gammaproteobacteria bacterium]